MERDIWPIITDALRRLRRRSPIRAVYSNRDILAVHLWAALHDRPISWACRRSSWPPQAWRRRLPDQSTMSRRLRQSELLDDFTALIAIVQRRLPSGRELIIDGKPLAVSHFSGDPDAAMGWGAGRFAPGYKLHAVIDTAHRLLAFAVHPMNKAECVVARELIETMDAAPRQVMLADAAYDSNLLYAACAQRGVRLIAPRRKANRTLSKSHEHHRDRVRAMEDMERWGPFASEQARRRSTIERFFGALASWGGGLNTLPTWTRRLWRVRAWVAAKLTLDAARRVCRTTT